jgi:hypothetical protein
VVGRSYPPEFYSWIKKPAVRSLFEKIAVETEEDYQNIIKKLKSFGVEVLRPDLPHDTFVNNKLVAPPMTPRDYTVMIGESFYTNYGWHDLSLKSFYNDVKDPSWPDCDNVDNFKCLPQHIQDECINLHHMNIGWQPGNDRDCYNKIYTKIANQGNSIIRGLDSRINGANVSRIGQDLYFGTDTYNQDNTNFLTLTNREFPNTRNHIVNTGGHSDGTYCPVCPGLIISLNDIPTYADTFPGWEVVYLPGQSWGMVADFLKLKEKNQGRWWIPGFEHDQDVVDIVEQWLGHWTGYVEETVFDVNMLIVDPKNVMVFNYNKQVFDALDRYGITPHIVPFRHRYFWDGGIHCVTSDLHREGSMQDYFPERN